MNSGFYQFAEEDALSFARTQDGRTRRHGDELQFEKCPMCHGGRGRDKWTFAINLKNGACNCKRSGCGYSGNMITLAKEFGFSLGRDNDAYYRLKDYTERRFQDFSRFRDKHAVPTDPAIAFLKSRGISEQIARKYELSTKNDREEVLVFPFRDPDGEIQMIKYRNMSYIKGVSVGAKEWSISNCKPILFGMFQCEDRGTLVITEGQLDSLSCAEAGIKNAVSVPTGANGFTWVPYCWDFVNEFETIIVFGDCEKGIITLSTEILSRWPQKTKVVQMEDYLDCKDANELLQKHGKEAVLHAVHNAKPIPDKRIKPMTEVKSVDIMKMPTLTTGLDSLDEILSGGFRVGQLILLTGKRGEGKSTLGSMFGVHALNHGYNAFFYSGELMDFYFRNWMDRQILGKDLSVVSTPEEDRLKLNQFYADKAFIYDNSTLTDDENDEIPKTVEQAIRQQGCQFVLIDNLMTAMDSDTSSDIYRAQSQFVGKLAELARRYSAIIVLIAHPRKSTGFNGFENDDVSGSGDITNKVDIVINYGRKKFKKGDVVTQEDMDMRELIVTKNRLTGRLTQADKPIRLVYDPESKRIAEKTKDFRKQTETFSKDFVEVSDEEMETLPFAEG